MHVLAHLLKYLHKKAKMEILCVRSNFSKTQIIKMFLSRYIYIIFFNAFSLPYLGNKVLDKHRLKWNIIYTSFEKKDYK